MRDIKKISAGQMTGLERFVDTLQKQDDTTFLMRKIMSWVFLFISVFVCAISPVEWTPRIVIMVMNNFSMGLLSMVFTINSPVVMRQGIVLNLYECLRYFPVGRLEIYSFLRKKLLRFLSLYGGLAVLFRLIITGAMTDSLGLGSLIFPLANWLVLALVGFSMIRVRMAWRYRKQVRSL